MKLRAFQCLAWLAFITFLPTQLAAADPNCPPGLGRSAAIVCNDKELLAAHEANVLLYSHLEQTIPQDKKAILVETQKLWKSSIQECLSDPLHRLQRTKDVIDKESCRTDLCKRAPEFFARRKQKVGNTVSLYTPAQILDARVCLLNSYNDRNMILNNWSPHRVGEQPTEQEKITAVLACFNSGGGKLTILDMYDCSGLWVTSATLMRCALGEQCPAHLDTMIEREHFNATLDMEGLTLTSLLTVNQRYSPSIPSKGTLQNCLSASKTEGKFRDCVLRAMSDAKVNKLSQCLVAAGDDQAKATSCIPLESDTKLLEFLTCANGRKVSKSVISECTEAGAFVTEIERRVNCSKNASSFAEATQCVVRGKLPPKEQAAFECLAGPMGSRQPAACLESDSKLKRRAPIGA